MNSNPSGRNTVQVNAPQELVDNWNERMQKSRMLFERAVRINRFAYHGSLASAVACTVNIFTINSSVISDTTMCITSISVLLWPIVFLLHRSSNKIGNSVTAEVEDFCKK